MRTVVQPSTTQTSTTTVKSTLYNTVTVRPIASASSSVASSSAAAAPTVPTVPTPAVTVLPTPGTYTIPATTITLSSETTLAAATTTTLSSSSEAQTYGGVTTVVETSTTIVCPYATVSPVDSTFTSIIKTTTYVCPSSGTYTIAPTTTTVSESTVMVYPTPASYSAGTYTQPETTITITRTSDVFVCPYTSSAQSTSASAPTSVVAAPSAPASSAPASSAPAASSVPASSAPVSSAPASSAPASSAYNAPSSSVAASSSSAPSPSSSSTSSPIGGGNQWCMTYSPYSSSGSCKGAEEVSADIAIIASKGFSSIRLYSTDCSGLENVGGAAKKYNLKLVLGIYISNTGISGAQAQVSAIVSWAAGNWAAVEMIVVGNEAVFNGYASMSDLAAFISSAKSAFKAAGYSGPVTTTEPINILQENAGSLCGVIDVVAANIHPFFNAGVSAFEAGKFVADQLKELEKVCPKLKSYNLETGWPHSGDANGKAVPGKEEQALAIKSIMKHAGGNSVFFSFVDDLWKQPGQLGVEQSWGCSQLFQKGEGEKED